MTPLVVVVVDGIADYMGENTQKNKQGRDSQSRNIGRKGGTAAAVPITDQDQSEELEELYAMYAKGLLSEKEYEKAKAQLLEEQTD